MKKLILFLSIAALFVSGCSFEAEVITPPPPEPAQPQAEFITPTPSFTPPAVPEAGFTPSASEPLFYAAYFTQGRDEFPGRYTFPAATRQIFAHWQYQNMRQGMIIRREWLLNGEPWLTREEAWDEATRGVYGTVPDISIYDLDAGLPSGKYELRLYIDGVIQPIGVVVNGRPETWAQFEILPDDSETGIPSPDGKWELFLSNGTLLFMKDTAGVKKELYGGVHIVARAWMPNSRHILFVDQNPNGARVGPKGSLPGTLLMLDSQTLDARILYSSKTVLGEAGGGLIVSPDGKFVAAIFGTGYGDACFLDSLLIFFEIADDYQSANIILQEQFMGLPTAANGVMYATAVGGWKNNTQFSVPMKGTCDIDISRAGVYIFDMPSRTAALEPGIPATFIAGDLGWGQIHGAVTNATTGKPIPGALVTCEHSSYTSGVNMRCAGGVYADANGAYVYQRIFFHDTDTIKLTVTAPGYQTQEYTQTAFTINDLTINFPLVPIP